MSNVNNTAAKQVKEDTENLKDKTAEKAENIKQGVQQKAEKLGEKTSEYKSKVSENISGAADKFDKSPNNAQGFLNGKTDVINEYAHQTIEKVNEIGHRAAAVLANSSDYIKKFDAAETRQQIKKSIKQKPELSLAIAGVFGLLIGLMIGRRNK